MQTELRAAHKAHLDDYWSLFLTACAVEGAAFMLLGDSEFTLLVCAKSLVMCTIWMGRYENGVFASLLSSFVLAYYSQWDCTVARKVC